MEKQRGNIMLLKNNISKVNAILIILMKYLIKRGLQYKDMFRKIYIIIKLIINLNQ